MCKVMHAIASQIQVKVFSGMSQIAGKCESVKNDANAPMCKRWIANSCVSSLCLIFS